MTKRQPFQARVWGQMYRTWWPPDSTRHRKRAKRRSAKRERQHTKQSRADDGTWPPTWFGSIQSGRADTAVQAEEIIRDEFGNGST